MNIFANTDIPISDIKINDNNLTNFITGEKADIARFTKEAMKHD